MVEVVVVNRVGLDTKYKPMGVTTLTQDAKDELDANSVSDYISARTGTLIIRVDPATGQPYQPDEDGYYTQSQSYYEPQEPPAVFVKKVDGTPTFWDFVANEEITIP